MPAKQDEHPSKQPSHSGTIRVLVVASNRVLQKALVDLVSQQPGIGVCARVSNLCDVDRSLMGRGAPNVVILDWQVVDQPDAQLLSGLLQMYPAARWLVLSIYDDPFSVKQALDMGVHGYVTKSMAAETICTAIRDLSAGRRYFSPDVLDTLPQSLLTEILE